MKIFSFKAVNKGVVLAGLVFLIHFNLYSQGCNCPELASCGPCNSGFTSITLRYNGPFTVAVSANDGSGVIYFNLLVNPGTIFTVEGSLANGKFSGNTLSLYVTALLNFSINTNCGTPVSIGQNFGSFTVLAAESFAGGPLCCDADDLETVDPVIVGCPGNILESSDGTGCSKAVSWPAPSATDNCGTAILTTTHPSGSIFPVGTTTVTYTATDEYGNTATCSFDVTVEDDTNPVINGCLSDIIRSADADCQATVTWSAPTATDNCGVTSFIPSHNSGDVFPIGTTPVVYTATDAAGNISTCTFNVIVIDDTDPVIAGCPLATISYPADASCQAVATWTPPTATDNCGTPILASSHSSGDTFPIGTTTVSYTATDAAGNVSTCTFDVEVNDETDPVITGCLVADILAVADGSCQAIVTWTEPTATDNCGVVSWSSDHSSGDTFPKGTTVVTYTAIDAAGNVATCTFNVVVSDETNPAISGCLSDITVTANALCQATVGWSAPFATDNCGIVDLSSNYSPGSIFPLGTTLVVYTAEDEAGNISTCEFNVIVQDDTDPVITGCPSADIIETADASCQATVNWAPPLASDNCSLFTLNSSHDPGDVFPLGTTVVIYTATDAAGNISTCTFNVVVNDNTDPVITGCISPDIVVAADASSCDAIVNWAPPIESDNCGPVVMSSSHDPGDAFPLGTSQVTYTATDGFGNVSTCVFNVVVEDRTNPILAGCLSSDILVTADASCQSAASWVPPIVSDNCGAMLSSNYDPGDIFPLGTTIVTYTATDDAGNTATCSFNVVVEDNTGPVFTSCPPAVLTFYTDASCQAIANWTPPVATDNCSVPILGSSHFPGDVFSLGTTTVTYTATDAAGNATTCVFDVVVEDDVAPLFTGCLSADIVVVADGACEAVANWSPPVATDNCGFVATSNSHDPGDIFPLGTTVVTYTATDGAGNTSTCSFNVIVNDETAPVFSGCLSDPIVLVADASCEAVANWIEPMASDNCSTLLLEKTHAPGDVFTVGTTVVTYKATDGSGNVTECTFNVIVEDKSNPVISGCPVSEIFVNANGGCQGEATWSVPVVTDNCSTPVLSSNYNSGDIFPLGTTQVVYTATDDAGNTSTCSFNVTVVDAESPVISGCFTADLTYAAGDGCEAAVDWVEPTAADNCGSVAINSSHRPGDIFPIGSTTVTYTFTDLAGNSSECSFDIVVFDATAPVMAGCSDIILAADNACQAKATWVPPSVTDCSSYELISTHSSGDFFSKGSTQVTYTATDEHGNSSSCSFFVVVEDKTPPTMVRCTADVLVNADSECEATVTWTLPAATDNCGGIAWSSTHSPGSLFPLGTTTVRYTATDDSGNSTICEFDVIVRNETTPIFENCPQDIVVTGDEYGEAVVEWIPPTAASICGTVDMSSSHNSGQRFNLGRTTVEYLAVDISGNRSSCRFDVIVEKQEIDIEISQLVTPDGNGVNDEWIVTNIEKFRKNKIVIVDRWGSVVYSASGYDNTNVVWRGVNVEGASVPTGTYFFSLTVEYGADSLEKTGFIELIR